MKQANRTFLRMICLLVAFTLLSSVAVFAAAAVEDTTATTTTNGTTTTTDPVTGETTTTENGKTDAENAADGTTSDGSEAVEYTIQMMSYLRGTADEEYEVGESEPLAIREGESIKAAFYEAYAANVTENGITVDRIELVMGDGNARELTDSDVYSADMIIKEMRVYFTVPTGSEGEGGDIVETQTYDLTVRVQQITADGNTSSIGSTKVTVAVGAPLYSAICGNGIAVNGMVYMDIVSVTLMTGSGVNTEVTQDMVATDELLSGAKMVTVVVGAATSEGGNEGGDVTVPAEAQLILKYQLVSADGSITEFDKQTVSLKNGASIYGELYAMGMIQKDGKNFLVESSSLTHLADGGRIEVGFDEKTTFDTAWDNAVLILAYGAAATEESATVAVREVDPNGGVMNELMHPFSYGTQLYAWALSRAAMYHYTVSSIGVIYADGSAGDLTQEYILTAENPVTKMELRYASNGNENEKQDIVLEGTSSWDSANGYGEVQVALASGAFASFQMRIYFPSNIRISDVLQNIDGDFVYNVQDGSVLITLSRDGNMNAHTTLFTIRYTVDYVGDSYMNFSDYRFVDENGNEQYNVSFNNFCFTMPDQAESLLGDANGDGYVDSEDYRTIQRVWVGQEHFRDDQCRDNADVNRDGNADILDVQWIRIYVNKGETLWNRTDTVA